MPAISFGDIEERPAVFIVFVWKEKSNAIHSCFLFIQVFFPHDGEEKRTGGVHDGYIWDFPVAVVGLERLDYAAEEGMLGDGAHGVVGDAGGDRAADPGRVGEEGREGALAAVVEVDVDAAVVGEDEVADGVGALDGVGVAVEGFEEPGVFFLYEFSRQSIGP